jgi:hypothetical protein
MRGRNYVAYIKLRIAERAEDNPGPTTPDAFRTTLEEILHLDRYMILPGGLIYCRIQKKR